MLAPTPINDEARISALRSINYKYLEDDRRLNQITLHAANQFNTPYAFITIVDKSKAFFLSSHGSDAKELPRKYGICSHVIAEINSRQPSERIYEIRDTLLNPKFAKNYLVVNPPNVRSYLSYTLQTKSGFNIGTLCIFDVTPRIFSSEEKFHLSILGEISNKIILTSI